MRFLFLTVLTFFCFSEASAQFDFNLKCTIKSNRIKPKDNLIRESSNIYYNSENPDIYIVEKKGFYRLFHNGTKEIYQFLKSNVNGKSVLATAGIEAMRLDYSEFEIKRVSVEKISNNKFLVKSFSNIKTKRSNLEVVFTLKKSPIPMTRVRFLDLSPTIHQKIYDELLVNLDNPNYQWEKAEVDYKNGYKFIYEVSNCQSTNMRLRFE